MAATITAVAAALSATAALGGTAYSLSQGSPDAPKPSSLPTAPMGPSPAQTAKQLLPGAKADAAARGLGGVAPDFLANMLSDQTGTPGAGLDVLDDIRRSLGQGAA